MISRAVIYARCSTEEESQKDALKKQVEEGKASVREKGWTLAGLYVESRSGTTTKGRSEYNRLYEDLTGDKFDIIVIKSQDRLMRNTKDWYLFVDRLLTEQKKLYIYIERKFYSTDDSLITGIKAILAEEYSRELSKKINLAHHNRQKQNGPAVLTSNTYGYRKMPDKSVVIVEEEARIKRRMYELCAAGFGCRRISSILKNEGVAGRNGKPFTDSAILRMIHNPLNMGTVVMNRLHYDFETKKVIQIPKEEQYVYENKVPPIVSKELWEAANQEIARRAEGINRSGDRKRGRYKGKSQISGKLFCGLCGNPYYRRTRRRYKDRAVICEWKCKRYLETGRKTGRIKGFPLSEVQSEETEGCDNVHLDEEMLYQLLVQICEKRYMPDKERTVCDMVHMLKIVLKEKDYRQEIDRKRRQEGKLMRQMDILAEKLLEGVVSDEVYQRTQKEIEEKVRNLREGIKELEKQKIKGNKYVLKERIAHIEKTLQTMGMIEKTVAAEMLENVDKIWIYPEYMEIVFNLPETAEAENTDISVQEYGNRMKIEYGNLFNYRKKKEEERNAIIRMMQEDPCITAREIAEKLMISLSGANYRIGVLKSEGKVKFNGSGGKGEWEIISPV